MPLCSRRPWKREEPTEVVAVVDCAPEDEPLLERLRREAPTRVSFGPASADEIVGACGRR